MTTIARLLLGIVFSWFLARTGDDNWTITYISIRYNILDLYIYNSTRTSFIIDGSFTIDSNRLLLGRYMGENWWR